MQIHESKLRYWDTNLACYVYYDDNYTGNEVIETIRNQVVDPDTLEWVNQVQGQSVGGEEEVAVTNWPTTQEVTGPLTDSELRASAIETFPKVYAQAIYEDGDVLYICKAGIGSSLSDAVWQIQLFDSGSSPMQTLWCDGNANFDNRATNLGVVQGHTYL